MQAHHRTEIRTQGLTNMTETLNLSAEALKEIVALEIGRTLDWDVLTREAEAAARQASTKMQGEK
jgi:hypothetical protein